MSEMSYKEACYAFMISVADEDNNVSADEKYVIDHFFDDEFDLFRLSDKHKKEIGSDLRTGISKEEYHKRLIAALTKEKKDKQMKAYELVCKYIYTHCPKSSSAWAVATKIQSQLGFTQDEFKEYEVWKKKK
jgi:hypothetical protein